LEAWNQGLVDAVACYQPTASRLENAGAVPLFDSSQMPETIFDVLVVTEKAVQEQPAAIAGLVRGHFLGLQHLVRNMHDAVYRIATRQEITPDAVFDAMATVMLPELTANRRYLAPGGRLDIIARRLGNILLREGLIEQMPDIANLCTRDFLPGSLM
ncbi:MAG: nitrate ABC transporter substrate-binding protein, partial [Marinobacter sp.]|nr:nitrate ABC transporter substrate-binding protein [Marinobacter sp.]